MRVAKFQCCKLYDIALGFKLTLFYNDYETIVKLYTNVRMCFVFVWKETGNVHVNHMTIREAITDKRLSLELENDI